MIAPALIVLALSTAGTAGITWGYQANKYERLLAEQRLEQSRTYVRALETAHAETIRLQDQSRRAQAAAAVRLKKLTADRDRLGMAADGLRDQLNTARDRLASATPAATREYAAAAGELLDQCARAYSGMAEKADGHALDARTLLESWPGVKP